MPREWEKTELSGNWKGLWARQTAMPGDTLYAEIASNVDFYGGVLGSRGGTMAINGAMTSALDWGSAAGGDVVDQTGFFVGDIVHVYDVANNGRARITSIVGSAITVTGLGFTPTNAARILTARLTSHRTSVPLVAWFTALSGFIDDSTQLVPGDVVRVVRPDTWVSELATVFTSTGNFLTLTAPLSFVPPVGTRFVRANLVAEDEGVGVFVRALGEARFRDGTRQVIAVVPDAVDGPAIYEIDREPRRAVVQYPVGTIAINWATSTAGQIATSTNGTIDGIAPGDIVALGTDLANHATVETVQTNGNITLVAPGWVRSGGGLPLAGDVFRIFPRRRLAPRQGLVAPQDATLPDDATMVMYANVLNIAENGYPPLKYYKFQNEYVIHRHGIEPPVSGVIAAANAAAGNPNGTYRYAVTFKNDVTGQESLPLFSLAPITVVNKKIDLGLNPAGPLPLSPDPQVTHRVIYRNVSGGVVWYLVAEVPNATATYQDDTADLTLVSGRQMRIGLDAPIPPGVNVLRTWPQENRLIGLDQGGNAVVFSDLFDLPSGRFKGESWPSTNQVFVSLDDGDPLVGLASLFESAIVLKARSSWRLSGDIASLELAPINFREDGTGIGVLGPKGLVSDQNELVILSLDGAHNITRYPGVSAGFESQRMSREIDSLWATINPAIPQTAHAAYLRRRRQVFTFLTLGTDTQAADLLVYQLDGDPDGTLVGWAHWTFHALYTHENDTTTHQGFSASATIAGDPTRIYPFGDATVDLVWLAAQGMILTFDERHSAEMSYLPVAWQYRTMPFAPAGAGMAARVRQVDVMFSVDSGTQLFDLEVRTDFSFAGPIGNLVTVPVSPITLTTPLQFSVAVLARGVWHQLGLTNMNPNSRFRIQNLAYWTQALPKVVQPTATPQTTITYPDSV